jgi:hypothetical protein
MQKLTGRPSVAPGGTPRAASILMTRGEDLARLTGRRGGGEIREGENTFFVLETKTKNHFLGSEKEPASLAKLAGGSGPGRDGSFEPPPGQNPACGFPAPGSHLGSTESEAGRGPRMKDAGFG